MSEAKLLEGKVLARQIQEEIKSAVEGFAAQNLEKPKLVALQPGEDPSAVWYINQQEKLAGKLGIDFQRMEPAQVGNQKALVQKIRDLNDSIGVGVFIAMPFPESFNSEEALLSLNPKKDVEGIHPSSLGLLVLRRAKLIPPTAFAAFRLIQHTGIKLRGKKATLIGQSAIVGRPLQLLLGEQRVTTVVCNTGTPEAEIKKQALESDIVIACAGKPQMVKGDWIREGAVVIDVGTTETGGKLVGDVDFEEAQKRAAFITPVPGGVGPLTVTMLMQNLITAYKWQKGL